MFEVIHLSVEGKERRFPYVVVSPSYLLLFLFLKAFFLIPETVAVHVHTDFSAVFINHQIRSLHPLTLCRCSVHHIVFSQ